MKVTPDDYGRRCQFDHFCKLVTQQRQTMPCRVVAKRRQKKGEKSAFVCVLRRFAD